MANAAAAFPGCLTSATGRIMALSVMLSRMLLSGYWQGDLVQYSFRSLLRLTAPFCLFLMQPAVAIAQSTEAPPSFNAAQIPDIKRIGANYTIQNPVRSDGLLRIYVLTTPYGDVTVQGDEMLRMRLNELNALALLEKVSNSDSFGKALAQAGLSPVIFTGRLITNPIDTVQNTLAGVGGFFGRVSSGIANAGKTPDSAVASLLGVTEQRRQLAAAYGVDPYTDFPPLNTKLEQLSQAAALGGLTVTGALLVIPGAAGIIVSNLSTAYKLNDIGIDELARNYTAAQILDLNRSRLAAMGVDPDLSARLLENRNYTPIDMAAMVAALDSMAAVKGREAYVACAAAVDARAIAYVMRRQAELMADDYRLHGGYGRFVALAGYPYVITRDGRVMTVAPIDALSWTSETASGFGIVTAERRHIAPNAHGVLRITGRATTLAKRWFNAHGWTVQERQRP